MTTKKADGKHRQTRGNRDHEQRMGGDGGKGVHGILDTYSLSELGLDCMSVDMANMMVHGTSELEVEKRVI